MAILRWRPAGQVLDRWDPFRNLDDIQSEMNRIFDGFLERPSGMPQPDRMWVPALDVHETKDELVITAELPGLNEKEIELSITGDVLTLRGERTQNQEVKQEGYHRGERWFGKFERTVPLPIPVQTDKVKATYRDGVLTVTLPKAEEIKAKSIKIDVL